MKTAEEIFKNAETNPDGYTLLAAGWLDVSTAPDYFSFRCLIKFEEFGMDGPEKNHISTGYWWHKDNCFTVDNVEMRNMTPKEFMPLYDDIG